MSEENERVEDFILFIDRILYSDLSNNALVIRYFYLLMYCIEKHSQKVYYRIVCLS